MQLLDFRGKKIYNPPKRKSIPVIDSKKKTKKRVRLLEEKKQEYLTSTLITLRSLQHKSLIKFWTHCIKIFVFDFDISGFPLFLELVR